MIESFRKDKGSVLLLDCGALFDHQKENAELHLKAMELMGYDALNLGIPEFYFGKEFLERTRSGVSFPYIASNLLYGGGRLPWTQEYIIKEVGGIKVAILGILDPADLKKIPPQDDGKGFEAIPPKAALDRLLPEVRGKANLVVLLSQLGEAENNALVEAARGIDVVITPAYHETLNLKPPENTIILSAVENGRLLGLASIMLDDKGVPSMSERTNVSMDSSVPDNEEILRLVETYKKEQEKKKAKMERELMEGLQLTPEEYLERYRRQQQTNRKKGEAR